MKKITFMLLMILFLGAQQVVFASEITVCFSAPSLRNNNSELKITLESENEAQTPDLKEVYDLIRQEYKRQLVKDVTRLYEGCNLRIPRLFKIMVFSIRINGEKYIPGTSCKIGDSMRLEITGYLQGCDDTGNKAGINLISKRSKERA